MAIEMQSPFVWGANGQRLTPEQISMLRALEARKQMQGIDTSPVAHWTQGAARVVDALGGVLRDRRLNASDAANRSEDASLAAPLLQALTGQSASIPMPGAAGEVAATTPAPAPSLDPSKLDQSIVTGIADTAGALGINPVDLATAISYETGGTFDPTKGGPTTQWGRHRGLIQFGEPQAQKYGVDWNNPIGSQLGPTGAVANYLRDTGVKPGASLLDIYSAINAGGVGRYNASDANNGGAPGTVRDKVEQQMARHRANALALFPETQTAPVVPVEVASLDAPQTATDAIAAQSPLPQEAAPAAASYAPQQPAPELPPPTEIAAPPAVAAQPPVQVAQAPQAQFPQVPQVAPQALAAAIQAVNSPYASPQTKSLANALIQRQQAAQQAQQEQATWLARQQYEAQQQAADPLRQLQIQEAQLKLSQAQNPPTPDSVRALQERARLSGLQEGTPEYNAFIQTGGVRTPPTISAPPTGYRYVYDANNNPVSVEAIPGSPQAREAEMAITKLEKAQDAKDISSDLVIGSTNKALEAMDNAILPTTGTLGKIASFAPESAAADVVRQIAPLQATASFETLNQMRQASPTGGALGAVSDSEQKLLQAKAGALDPFSPNFKRDLLDYEKSVLRIVHGKDAGDKIFEEAQKARQERANQVQTDIPGVIIRRKN